MFAKTIEGAGGYARGSPRERELAPPLARFFGDFLAAKKVTLRSNQRRFLRKIKL